MAFLLSLPYCGRGRAWQSRAFSSTCAAVFMPTRAQAITVVLSSGNCQGFAARLVPQRLTFRQGLRALMSRGGPCRTLAEPKTLIPAALAACRRVYTLVSGSGPLVHRRCNGSGHGRTGAPRPATSRRRARPPQWDNTPRHLSQSRSRSRWPCRIHPMRALPCSALERLESIAGAGELNARHLAELSPIMEV